MPRHPLRNPEPTRACLVVVDASGDNTCDALLALEDDEAGATAIAEAGVAGIGLTASEELSIESIDAASDLPALGVRFLRLGLAEADEQYRIADVERVFTRQ